MAARPTRASAPCSAGFPARCDGSGRDRDTLKHALALLSAAGWELRGRELRERSSGRLFSFELLVGTKDQERLALAYLRDLKRAGIEVRLRVVDPVQFDRRKLTYDFDMLQYRWDQSLSPGNEQGFYWGSEAADIEGTRNYMGIRSKAADAAIAALLQARERDEFVSAVRALDRVLISGFYVVPLFHLPHQWLARWAQIRRPDKTSLFGYLPETWWEQTQIR
jgi:peptide/nickel transport system substrate-binding protein